MTGISLNEDNSHFFGSRSEEQMNEADIDAFVDQYKGSDVRELILCASCMCTNFDSKVWDPIWKGIDFEKDEIPCSWPRNAYVLHQKGIDAYERWIARSRTHGISPWISMRMNDIHYVDEPECYIHSTFWKEHPEYQRAPYRFDRWQDRAFDFGHEEVRDYHLALIEEYVERYPGMDGLELDWMRFGFHFGPGREEEGCEHLNGFMREARRITEGKELGVRVPVDPATARGLGMDAVAWAKQGWIDRLVAAPFYTTIDFDIPIEQWKELTGGTKVMICAGLEVRLQAYRAAEAHNNTIETVRGAAANMLHRGADRVYLFNYMDSDTCMDDLTNYYQMLREIGSLETLKGKKRRHVVTFKDTEPPGVSQTGLLPSRGSEHHAVMFRMYTGPSPDGEKALAVIGFDGPSHKAKEVRVNTVLCEPQGVIELKGPHPANPALAFKIPKGAVRGGYNLLEVRPAQETNVTWAEVMVS